MNEGRKGERSRWMDECGDESMKERKNERIIECQ